MRRMMHTQDRGKKNDVRRRMMYTQDRGRKNDVRRRRIVRGLDRSPPPHVSPAPQHAAECAQPPESL